LRDRLVVCDVLSGWNGLVLWNILVCDVLVVWEILVGIWIGLVGTCLELLIRICKIVRRQVLGGKEFLIGVGEMLVVCVIVDNVEIEGIVARGSVGITYVIDVIGVGVVICGWVTIYVIFHI
jgi:hypothetical protein